MTQASERRFPPGVWFAIGSAALFGLSTPCAKLLLGETSPLLLAGLLYAGSSLGLSIVRQLLPVFAEEAPLTRRDVPWLAGATLAGGVLGPLLLLSGLETTPASVASLLLNLEGVFTALLAWFVFRENFDRRVALGFLLIVAGGAILSVDTATGGWASLSLGSLAIVAACLCWAIDNNLTQKVSGADPLLLAAVKGGVAGAVNLALAGVTGAAWPSTPLVGAALVLGFLGYGVSLALFVLALRHLGSARTGAYFSLAPFLGAVVSLIILREPVGIGLVAAGVLMLEGVWLHLTEKHEHTHTHERLGHAHRHEHDEHHRHHPDDPALAATAAHTHEHVHDALTHRHPHFPDIHHRHPHA